MINLLLPYHSRRREYFKRNMRRVGLLRSNIDPEYQYWIENVEQQLFRPVLSKKNQTKISVIVPCYNTPDKYLLPMFYSVVDQAYDNWELIIVNGSESEERKNRINNLQEIDSRVRVIELNKNKGISANTNEGLKLATGEFITLLDHDDVLSPYALNEVGSVLHEQPEVDIIYSDEDKINESGIVRYKPHFKPNWSPDLLRNVNYITHMLTFRKSLLEAIGLMNQELDGAQDYDFTLRLTDYTKQITHISKVLYHWREAKGSTAANFSVKQGVLESGQKALQKHLDRNKINGKATIVINKPGYYNIDHKDADPTKLTVVCSIKPNATTLKVLERAKFTLRVVKDEESRSEFINNQVGDIKTEFVLYINTDLKISTETILKMLSMIAANKGIKAIAPRVINNDRIIDMGYTLRLNGLMSPLFYGRNKEENTDYGDTDWVRDVDMLSGRIFIMRTEELKVSFGLCNNQDSLFGFNSVLLKPDEEKRCVVLSTVDVSGGAYNSYQPGDL